MKHLGATTLLLLGLGAVGCGDREGDAPRTDAGEVMADTGSSGDAGAFMCGILADPSLCWNDLVDRLYACVPSDIGVLDAERTTCTFADGTTITFAQPLPTRIEGPPPYMPDLIVRDGAGEDCGSFYDRGARGRAVSTDLEQAVFIQEEGNLRMGCLEAGVLTYDFDAPFEEVFDCAFSHMLALPGWQATVDETSIQLAIVSSGNGNPDPLFECRAP